MRGGIFIFICFVIGLFPLVIAITGETITGEASQQPTNVSIFVSPIAQTTKTDDKGYFEIIGLNAGDYELLIFVRNYKTVKKVISLATSVELEIKLSKLEIELSEVLIEAEKEAQRARDGQGDQFAPQ